MGKRISPESIINQNLSLGLDQFLRNINKRDMVSGTGNMEGVPPDRNENAEVQNNVLCSLIHPEKHSRKQTKQGFPRNGHNKCRFQNKTKKKVAFISEIKVE